MAKIIVFLALCLWCCDYVGGGSPEESVGKVTFLDVGQGLSVLLEYNGHYGLYDAGPDSAGLVDTLRGRGVDSLDWFLVGHGHRDHLGGLLELLAGTAVSIGRLYVGPDTAGVFVDSVLRAACRLRIPVDTVGRGNLVSLGSVYGDATEGLLLHVLWPPRYLPVRENGASVVARVSLAGDASGSILLTGDLDSLGEIRLQEMSADLSADLLQVGHHGSAHSSTFKFLNKVSPRYAVISVGSDNSYGHPTEPVLKKLQYVLGDSSAIRRTDRDGSVAYLLVPDVGVVPEK